MKSQAITIRKVKTNAELKKFIEYPYKHYQYNNNWIPPLRIAEWQRFNKESNPFFKHAQMDLFLAEENGKIVGRIAAIDDHNHNCTHGENLCFFGFFEASSSPVARALFNIVEAWGKGLGRSAIRGPVNPTMNDSCGFQIDAFNTSPFIMMPYNTEVYPKYAELSGYQKAKDLYAWLFDTRKGMPERMVKLAKRVMKRTKASIRTLALCRYHQDMAIIKKIYNQAWIKNWGFVKYTEYDFDHLAKALRRLIDPNVAIFVEVNDKPAGMAIILPDINQVLKKINGNLLPLGWYALLNSRRHINQGRLPLLGVMPEYRMKGLESVLIHEAYSRASQNGYILGECSWVLEDNKSMNDSIKAAGCTLYKTYRLYQKNL